MAYSRPDVSTPHSEHGSEDMETLLQDIKRLALRYKLEEVEHILLIGRSGVGKSGIVNTIAKVVNGEFFPLVEMGSGETQSNTLELIRLENCGALTDLPLPNLNVFGQREVRVRLPHITDFAGLGNVDNNSISDIFQYLVEGYIPPGTAYQTLEEQQKEHGSLNAKYTTPHEEWKVTKVVFVQGGFDQIPDKLIRCLLKTLRAKDQHSDAVRYRGGIHLLITKFDLVETSFNVDPDNAEFQENVSLEQFERVEKELAQLFSIKGNLEFKMTRWVNYCDQTGHDNKHIDLIVLKFLRNMMMPVAKRPRPNRDITARLMELEHSVMSIVIGLVAVIARHIYLIVLKFLRNMMMPVANRPPVRRPNRGIIAWLLEPEHLVMSIGIGLVVVIAYLVLAGSYSHRKD